MTTRAATKEERQLAYLWLAAAVSAFALKPLWLAVTPFLRPCVFRSITGIPCPTCGSTRAATAVLQLDLISALAANPLASIAGLIFLIGAPLAVLWAIARWPIPFLRTPVPMWVRVGGVAVVAVNWLYVIAVD